MKFIFIKTYKKKKFLKSKFSCFDSKFKSQIKIFSKLKFQEKFKKIFERNLSNCYNKNFSNSFF